MVYVKHDVVISGISGKFPECFTLGELKDKLLTKASLLKSDVRRWNPAKDDKPFTSGKIPEWDKFDLTFFGVYSRLIRNCDPMMGLMLERSFEAIVDAGINPFSMKGKNVCVVSATSISDPEALRIVDGMFLDGFGMVGHSRSMMANRLSYFYNFTGPSFSLDSSWASATQSLEKAATLVADGLVESAIVVTCSLLCYNSIDNEYKNMNFLSPEGKCSPFDGKANGFARSEAVVALFIQRAQDAKRHYCTVIDTQTRCLGDRMRSYIQVSPRLETFFKDFYSSCSVNPADISYVEMGGFCDTEFDAEELNAVAKVFCSQKKGPLLIGSVSGNVGNTEGPSGFVSLAKTIIAMESGVIPPTVNYSTPNPGVPALISGQLRPVTEATALTGDLVAANCLNCYGSVGHALLKRNKRTKTALSVGQLPADGLPRLVLLQARHEEGAKTITDKVCLMPADVEFASLVNDVFSTPIPAYLWRAYSILPAVENQSARNIQIYNPSKRPLWFIFSGMGSQWSGMGKDLLHIPVFAAAIEKCDKVLGPRGVDIKYILTADDTTVFDNILNCFVGIAAIQIGLVDILFTLGVTPDGMIGHSVGELGCAYADGCFSAEEMVLAAYARGKASLESQNIPGMMAAIGIGYADIKDRLPSSIDVACHNARDSCTLSGPTNEVLTYVDQLKKDGVFAKAVSAGGIAYHSRYIRVVAPKLLNYLREVVPNPKPRSPRWISSSVPQSQWDTDHARMCSAEYHTNNLLNPVLFEEACKHLPKDAILVEIAPHGLLQAILRRSVSTESVNLSLTNRGASSNLNHFLNSIGQLYLNSIDININALYPSIEYPVARGTPGLVDLITWDHNDILYQEIDTLLDMMLNKGSTEKIIEINPKVPEFKLWKDHCLEDLPIVPLFQLMMFPWKMIFDMDRLQIEQHCVSFENLTISDYIPVQEPGKLVLVTILAASSTFEISFASEDTLSASNIVTGKIYKIGSFTPSFLDGFYDEEHFEVVTEDDVYCVLAQFGCHLGPQFRSIKQILIGESGCYAEVCWTGNMITFIDALFKIVVFLKTDQTEILHLPSHFNKLSINIPLLLGLVPDTTVKVYYSYSCNALMCEGVELLGLTLSPVYPKKPANLIWKERKLQPYFDSSPSLEEFLCTSLQLVSDSGLGSWSKLTPQINIFEILLENQKPSVVTVLLKEAIRKRLFIPYKLMEIDFTKAKELMVSSDYQSCLLVGDYKTIASLVVSEPIPTNVYFIALLQNNETPTRTQPLKQVLCYQSVAGNLALLKKVNRNNKALPFEIKSSDWLKNLRQLVAKDGCEHSVIVVCRNLTPRLLLPILAAESFTHLLRTVFIMDQKAPHFSLTSSLYSAQLSLGLPVNILSNGVWHTLNTVTLHIVPHRKHMDSLIKSSKEDLDVCCIGLNNTKLMMDLYSTTEKVDLKIVDYAGFKHSARVMGVAQFDPVANSVTPDQTLWWVVPADWTLEDAASVPVIYALAYYCLRFKTEMAAGESILVQAAMSPLGQAFIQLVLQMGGNIFATVKEEEDIIRLLKLFPLLEPRHIFLIGSEDMSTSIRKLTAGRGVDIVINCLRGKDMQRSVKVLGSFGRFVHLSKIKFEDRESLGMLVFLKQTSLYGVSLDNIVNCSDMWKSELQEAVQKGINQGIVKPCKTSSFSLKAQNEALNHLKVRSTEEKTIVVIKKEKDSYQFPGIFHCNPNTLTLIAGTNSDMWLDVTEWLVRHGARRLIVLTEEDQFLTNQVRRFNKLMNYNRTTIMLSSLSRVGSLDTTMEFFKDTLQMGTISSIFCLGMDENSCTMKNLNSASRELVPGLEHFVCLLGKGATVCESRAVSGLPVCCVQSDSPLQSPANVVPYLSAILADNSSKSRFFLVSDEVRTVSKRGKMEIQSFLPSSMEEICRMGIAVSSTPSFTEVVTRSPRFCYSRYSLLPVFVVPGLGADCLQPLLSQLMHPAFCSSLPAYVQSVSQFAESLLHDVLNVQKLGSYNIVGESWNGAVAMVLGSLLEGRGHHVDLFLLNGAPSMAQDVVAALCDQYSSDLISSLLATLAGTQPKVITDISHHSWEEKLQCGVQHMPLSQRDAVQRAITCIHSQLTALLQFQPSQLFGGKLTLITHRQPTPAEIVKLSQFCQQTPRIVIVECDNHHQLVTSFKTATVINENVSFNWKI